MRISDWSSDVCSSDLHFLIRMADEGEQALRIDDFLGDSFGFEMALSYCEIEAFTEHRLGQRAFNVDALGVGLHRVRSEEHTPELQSLMRIPYAVFSLKQKRMSTLLQSTNNTPLA